ncbi:MAG: tetratricopeptide repeat protein, partial [bacterium]|nr:tetratricopeptide repeat protein [bacterium]
MKNNPDKDIEFYSKAIELEPKDPMLYYERANSYYDLKNYDKAIEDYNKAIELKPECSNFYNDLGVCYEDLEQFEKAIGNYNKAIEINAEDKNAHFNKGYCYQTLGHYEMAIDSYNKAKEINPEDEFVYVSLGGVYSLLNEKDKSLECLKISFEKGLRDFEGIEEDTDYDNIRDTIEFISLISNTFFQNDTFLGEHFLVCYCGDQFNLMKRQYCIFPLILRNVNYLRFSDMLHHFKVTLPEHFIMCVIDYNYLLSPKRLAKQTASLGEGDFRGEYSEVDYLSSIDSCIDKGWLRLNQIDRCSSIKQNSNQPEIPDLYNPKFEEGTVDFTKTGYHLHRKIIKTIFGERVLKYHDSGW